MNWYKTLEQIAIAKNLWSKQNAHAKIKSWKIVKKDWLYYMSEDIINEFKANG